MTRIHWVARGTGIPKDRDVVNRREVSECDGWVCDVDMMCAPSELSVIRKAASLSRANPTLRAIQLYFWAVTGQRRRDSSPKKKIHFGSVWRWRVRNRSVHLVWDTGVHTDVQIYLSIDESVGHPHPRSVVSNSSLERAELNSKRLTLKTMFHCIALFDGIIFLSWYKLFLRVYLQRCGRDRCDFWPRKHIIWKQQNERPCCCQQNGHLVLRPFKSFCHQTDKE